MWILSVCHDDVQIFLSNRFNLFAVFLECGSWFFFSLVFLGLFEK